MQLEKLSYQNLEACFKIKQRDSQKTFICSNEFSIAHAFLELQEGNMIPYPYLVKEGQEYVGFLMLSYCKANPQYPGSNNAYCIWRVMIDQNYQGKGYGRQCIEEGIKLAQTKFAGPADTIVLFVEPNNPVAIKLYESCGFIKTDEIIDGETKYVRQL